MGTQRKTEGELSALIGALASRAQVAQIFRLLLLTGAPREAFAREYGIAVMPGAGSA
jgi:hypothetical protein